MAAPSGTVWGSVVSGSGGKNYQKGKIGIYATTSSTATITSVRVQIWFATPYSCTDSSNNLYFNIGAGVTSASTNVGSASIYHTVDSGDAWNSSNQTKIFDKTYDYKRNQNAQTCNIYAKFTGIDIVDSKAMYVNTSVTIPALASYTVSYNANGGSGAPSSQTKYYGQTLTLSSTKPTKTGYSFKGWSTSSTATSASYSPGGSYTNNSSVTLYAVWQVNTYTVSYNANGGSGAPSSQTKTYGVNLTLSSIKPTRTDYKFLGWGLSASSTTVSYSPGATYSANSGATLYAVWELAYTPPTITGLKASRCDSDGTTNDLGAYAKIEFAWSCCQLTGTNNISSISITYYKGSLAYNVSVSASGTSGNVSEIIGDNSLDTDTVYKVTVTVKDSLNGVTEEETIVPYSKFVIDFLSGGGGVALGKPAETSDLFEVGFNSKFNKDVTMVGNAQFSQGITVTGNAQFNGGITSAGDSQFSQNVTIDGSLKVDGWYFSQKMNSVIKYYNSSSETDILDTAIDTNMMVYCSSSTNSGLYNALGKNYAYVQQYFYSSRSSTSSRMQIAHGYTSNVMATRYYYDGTWSSWTPIITKGGVKNKVLWSGALHMNASQTITLSEAISSQVHGIVLACSHYDSSASEAKNYYWNYEFIPKYHVSAHSGTGVYIKLYSSSYLRTKYLYISDTSIKGYADNSISTSVHGVSGVNNGLQVLRYVLGV